MRKMPHIETITIRRPQDFMNMYNSNIELVNKLFNKLINKTNKHDTSIFLTNLGCIGMMYMLVSVASEVVKIKERLDIIQKEAPILEETKTEES